MAKKTNGVLLPPGCGEALTEPYLFNPYLDTFDKARRQRFCLNCNTTSSMGADCVFVCAKCKRAHESNLTAPRVYDQFSLLAGRGGGKTLGGAYAALSEMMVPNSIGWAMGPTYKILHDSTFPTLIRRVRPEWVKKWDPENMELKLTNGAMVAFRSLEDPERARGPHGISWGWFDEAAQSPVRAYNVFLPTLTKAGGIVIATTTPLGYDWTYDEIEKRATVYKEPGYFHISWWTEENPLFRSNPVMMRSIERARSTMTPEFFAQEYRAERHNATALIYDYLLIANQTLKDADSVRAYIPEWPNLDPSRQVIVGLDSGVDHPFGAVLIVVTERGLVVVAEYLERNKALSQHLQPIFLRFGLARFPPQNIKWAANKNEANLRLEFGLMDVGVIPAESKHEIGIQRVQSWLYTHQLLFAYTVPRTLEQMQAYRRADNVKPSGEKKVKEEVFKLKDELPDALRYGLMAWPQLPEPAVPDTPYQRRLAQMDEKTRFDVERMRDYHEQDKKRDLTPCDRDYPVGDFFAHVSGGY